MFATNLVGTLVTVANCPRAIAEGVAGAVGEVRAMVYDGDSDRFSALLSIPGRELMKFDCRELLAPTTLWARIRRTLSRIGG